MEVRCRPAVMCCVFAILCSVVPRSLESAYRDRQYLNEWAVEIPGGQAAAEAIAKELDYQLVRQVGTDDPESTPVLVVSNRNYSCSVVLNNAVALLFYYKSVTHSSHGMAEIKPAASSVSPVDCNRRGGNSSIKCSALFDKAIRLETRCFGGAFSAPC